MLWEWFNLIPLAWGGISFWIGFGQFIDDLIEKIFGLISWIGRSLSNEIEWE